MKGNTAKPTQKPAAAEPDYAAFAAPLSDAELAWSPDWDQVSGDQVTGALRQITRAIDLHSRSLLHQCGLTSPQLATLQAISRDQPIAAGRLSKQLHLGQPTVTGILDRLERRGLVARVRAERDRRSVMLTLTAAGRDVLRAAPASLHGFSRQLRDLKPWERALILSSLQRVADMLEQSAREHCQPPSATERDAAEDSALSRDDGRMTSEGLRPESVNGTSIKAT